MRSFVLRRLLTAAVALLGILFVDFALIHMPGVDYVPSALTAGARLDAEEITRHLAELRAHYRLDEPILVQFGVWLGRVATLDLGRSMDRPLPVLTVIGDALPATLLLQGISLLAMFGIGVPLGVLLAVHRSRRSAGLLSLVLYGIQAIPRFWLATLLFLYLATGAGVALFPLGRLTAPDHDAMGLGARLFDLARHLVLPVTALALPGITVVARYTRTSLLEVLGQDYILAARALGLSERTIVWRRALRNGATPLVTLFGSLLPVLVGGSIVVELTFDIDGMGLLLWRSTHARDFPVLQALALLTGVVTLLGFTSSDVAAAALDPRIRLR